MTADHSESASAIYPPPALDWSRILLAARSLISASTRALVITHVNPDGDAIGSALGLGLALRALGKEVVFACADSVPDTFNFLPASGEFTAAPKGDFDLIAVVDVSDVARMGTSPRWSMCVPGVLRA